MRNSLIVAATCLALLGCKKGEKKDDYSQVAGLRAQVMENQKHAKKKKKKGSSRFGSIQKSAGKK